VDVFRIIFFKLLGNDEKKCKQNSTVNKIVVVNKNYSIFTFYNLSLITKIFCRFSGIFIKKTTFEEFEEICEQIHREQEIQYNDEKGNNSNLTNFF